MIVAVIGLLINIAVAWSLSRDQKNVNTRAAFVHVLGDLLGSVAAITSGALIYFGATDLHWLTRFSPLSFVSSCCMRPGASLRTRRAC